MKRKLITKIQKILPNIPTKVNTFSNVIVLNADTEDLLERKGNVFCVFSIGSATEIDTALVTKIIQDILHDSYYQADTTSPSQALEKSITEIRDRVFKITNDSDTEFNVVCGALWGNIFYYVQYGAGNGFLVREGNIKEINLNSEGKFSTASGIVKDEDVVILNTQKFGEEYSPSKLLNTAIAIQNLTPNATCLIIKFQIDKTFSQEEVINFKSPIKKAKEAKFKGFLSNISEKLPLRNLIKSKYIPVAISVVIAVATISGVFLLIKQFYKSQPSEINPETVVQESSGSVQGLTDVASQATEPEVDKTFLATVDPFYDLKIDFPDINPTEIVFSDTDIIVTDPTTGKIYISNSEVAKFTPLEGEYKGVKSIGLRKNLLIFQNEGNIVIKDPLQQVSDKVFSDINANLVSSYLDFIYTTENDVIHRYGIQGTSLDPYKWATSSEFSEARSMNIAISIFLITKNGELVRYSRGEKDNFEIKGLTKALKSPTQIIASINYKNLYILEPENKRVVVIDSDGNFITQIKHENPNTWTNLKSISINDQENEITLLDGTKIYTTSFATP